jgi:RNA polymerase sigma-70 factor (ECF subfamily)
MGIVNWMFGGQKRRPINEARVAELLAHLDAAYMLARCLTDDECAAGDAVQESFLHAFRRDSGTGPADVRTWLLTIVRNTCMARGRRHQLIGGRESRSRCYTGQTSEAVCVQERNAPSLEDALYSLAPEFREVVLLRELHELSYREISKIVGVPVGMVMSRLSRARISLQQKLLSGHNTEIGAECLADGHKLI